MLVLPEAIGWTRLLDNHAWAFAGTEGMHSINPFAVPDTGAPPTSWQWSYWWRITRLVTGALWWTSVVIKRLIRRSLERWLLTNMGCWQGSGQVVGDLGGLIVHLQWSYYWGANSKMTSTGLGRVCKLHSSTLFSVHPALLVTCAFVEVTQWDSISCVVCYRDQV